MQCCSVCIHVNSILVWDWPVVAGVSATMLLCLIVMLELLQPKQASPSA